MKFKILALLIALSGVANAASQLGRTPEINWPDLGDAAGAGQVNTIQTSVQALSDNDDSRYYEYSAIADSTVTQITHGLGALRSELSVTLYSGSGATKSIIQDPIAAGWVFADGDTPKTQIKITTPGAGGPHTFTVAIQDAQIKADRTEQLIATAPSVPPSGNIKTWRDSNGRGLSIDSSGFIGATEYLPIKHVSSSFNALPGFHYVVDSSGGPVTATLPASVSDYDMFQFSDATKTFNTNNLTIARNGNNIDGDAADYVLNVQGDGIFLVGDNTNSNWVKASSGAAGGSGEGGTNYYENGLFENDVTTGVSVSSGVGTVTAETTSPLQGDQSALVTQGAGAAVVVDFAISGIDGYVIDGSIIPLSEAVIKLDAADANADANWGIWNVTDATWLQGPNDLNGAGVINYVRELSGSALQSGKTYVGRLTRVDNTTGREIIIDRLRLDPNNGGAVIPEADTTSLGVNYAADSDSLTLTDGNKTSASSTFIDITGLTISVTLTKAGRIAFEMSGMALWETAGTGTIALNVDIDGSPFFGTSGLIKRFDVLNEDFFIMVTGMTDVLPAGTYTLTGRRRSPSSHSWSIFASTGSPLRLSAHTVY